MSSRRNRRAHPSGSRRIPGGSAGTPTRRRGSPSRCRLRVSASRTRDAPGAGGLMESGSQMQAWPRGRHGNADPTTQELPGKEGEKAARSADGTRPCVTTTTTAPTHPVTPPRRISTTARRPTRYAATADKTPVGQYRTGRLRDWACHPLWRRLPLTPTRLSTSLINIAYTTIYILHNIEVLK